MNLMLPIIITLPLIIASLSSQLVANSDDNLSNQTIQLQEQINNNFNNLYKRVDSEAFNHFAVGDYQEAFKRLDYLRRIGVIREHEKILLLYTYLYGGNKVEELDSYQQRYGAGKFLADTLLNLYPNSPFLGYIYYAKGLMYALSDPVLNDRDLLNAQNDFLIKIKRYPNLLNSAPRYWRIAEQCFQSAIEASPKAIFVERAKNLAVMCREAMLFYQLNTIDLLLAKGEKKAAFRKAFKLAKDLPDSPIAILLPDFIKYI